MTEQNEVIEEDKTVAKMRAAVMLGVMATIVYIVIDVAVSVVMM